MLKHEVQGRTSGKATGGNWSRWYRMGASESSEKARAMLDLARIQEVEAGRMIVVEAGSGFRSEDVNTGAWYEFRLFLPEPKPESRPVTASMVRYECGCVGFAPEADGTAVLVWSCDRMGYGFEVWDMSGRRFQRLSAEDERAIRSVLSRMSILVY